MAPKLFRKRHAAEEITPIPAYAADLDVAGMEQLKHLHEFEKIHKFDPNFPIDELNDLDAAIATCNAEKGIEIEHALMEDNSPYPEVRAVVRNYDVDVPANTVRAWVIGMFLCTLGSGINMLFSLRDPTITINTYVIQLIAYPIGLGWDLIMPDRVWNLFGLKFNLRPGKFNFKEHVVIVAMSNVRIHVHHLSRQPPFTEANPHLTGFIRWWCFVCHRCAPDPAYILQPDLQLRLPDAVWHHDPMHRLRARWSCPSISRLASSHDLAC